MMTGREMNGGTMFVSCMPVATSRTDLFCSASAGCIRVTSFRADDAGASLYVVHGVVNRTRGLSGAHPTGSQSHRGSRAARRARTRFTGIAPSARASAARCPPTPDGPERVTPAGAVARRSELSPPYGLGDA
jgi:hypothetical protein